MMDPRNILIRFFLFLFFYYSVIMLFEMFSLPKCNKERFRGHFPLTHQNKRDAVTEKVGGSENEAADL